MFEFFALIDIVFGFALFVTTMVAIEKNSCTKLTEPLWEAWRFFLISNLGIFIFLTLLNFN